MLDKTHNSDTLRTKCHFSNREKHFYPKLFSVCYAISDVDSIITDCLLTPPHPPISTFCPSSPDKKSGYATHGGPFDYILYKTVVAQLTQGGKDNGHTPSSQPHPHKR